MHSWDDLRYILSVADCGSVAAAARALGVNHTTVLRHVSAFEKRHDVRLFDRLSSGYRLTDEGGDLVAGLRDVQTRIAALERQIAGRERRLEGRLRMTTTDSVLLSALGGPIATFRAAYPRITLEITMTNGRLDLSNRAADVAIRPSLAPPESLVGVRAAPLGFGVYGGSGYLSGAGDKPLAAHLWLGLDALLGQSPPARWMRSELPDVAIALRADSFVALGLAAAENLGLAVLPCCLGDTQAGLVRVRSPVPEMETHLWILTHPDLRRTATVRAFFEHFSAALRANSARLRG